MSEDLQQAFSDSDKYQAVYGSIGLTPHGVRSCLDRCMIIEKHIPHDVRILDVGCAQGFISLYFAARGANVTGIDAVEKNVEFCRLLAQDLKIHAKFKRQFFTDSAVQLALDSKINVVFLLSVLHHIITAKGLTWTRSALAKLLDSGVTIVAELAKKNEAVTYGIWKDHVPDNELVVFGDYASRAVKIGQSKLLNNKVTRPLYLITGEKAEAHVHCSISNEKH